MYAMYYTLHVQQCIYLCVTAAAPAFVTARQLTAIARKTNVKYTERIHTHTQRETVRQCKHSVHSIRQRINLFAWKRAGRTYNVLYVWHGNVRTRARDGVYARLGRQITHIVLFRGRLMRNVMGVCETEHSALVVLHPRRTYAPQRIIASNKLHQM